MHNSIHFKLASHWELFQTWIWQRYQLGRLEPWHSQLMSLKLKEATLCCISKAFHGGANHHVSCTTAPQNNQQYDGWKGWAGKGPGIPVGFSALIRHLGNVEALRRVDWARINTDLRCFTGLIKLPYATIAGWRVFLVQSCSDTTGYKIEGGLMHDFTPR